MDYGLLALIIAILDIYVVAQIIRSPSSLLGKLFWTATSIIVPVLGAIAWVFLAPVEKEQTV